jgi:8-oxo-dGTP pyrophosphatase MutT (NUDIX family)
MNIKTVSAVCAALLLFIMQTPSWSMHGVRVELDKPIPAGRSVYVCVYNDAHEFLIAEKNSYGFFFGQNSLRKRKKIDNNPGQLVFPGGHLEYDSTVLDVAENEFKAEIGMTLGYFGNPEFAIGYTDQQSGCIYYAVYVNAGFNLTQSLLNNINKNFRKNDRIRRFVASGNEDECLEEYGDESFVYSKSPLYVEDDELKSLHICSEKDILSKFGVNDESRLDQSWFRRIAQRAITNFR